MMHEQTATRPSKRSYLALGGAIISGLFVGLGIGMTVAGESDAEPEVTLPAAVQEFHADWFQAWDEADGDAVLAMMARAAVITALVPAPMAPVEKILPPP